MLPIPGLPIPCQKYIRLPVPLALSDFDNPSGTSLRAFGSLVDPVLSVLLPGQVCDNIPRTESPDLRPPALVIHRHAHSRHVQRRLGHAISLLRNAVELEIGSWPLRNGAQA